MLQVYLSQFPKIQNWIQQFALLSTFINITITMIKLFSLQILLALTLSLKPAQHNGLPILHLEEPIRFEITLNCQSQTSQTFWFGSHQRNGTFMLRLDYQPNKCIQAPQDILIQNKSYINIVFQKTCCNLTTNHTTEKVKIVAILRQAYSVLGFPVSKKFICSDLPIIAILIAGVLLWVVFLDQGYNPKIDEIKWKNKST